MQFAKAFTYPFDDPDWLRKIGIPAILSLIPIVGVIFLAGWMLDVTRRVMLREPRPLPEVDFGRQLVDGLKVVVVGLVYAIPLFLILSPVWVLALISGNIDENLAGTLMTLSSLCCGGLGFLYALLLGFLTPAAYANMVAKDRLGAAFQLNEVFGLLRAAPGAYLLALLGMILSTAFIAPLGGFACGIGALFTGAYAMAINGHLYGQAYLEATQNRGLAY